MNIHEYQAKSILRRSGVAVPEGFIAETPDNALNAAICLKDKTGTNTWVIKAQVHAGGRGKAGGIKITDNVAEVKDLAASVIGMTLVTKQTGTQGKLVKKVLVEQGIYYPGRSEVKEFYLSILLNRKSGRNMFLYSPRGGMDIETVAEETPEYIFTEEIDPGVGLLPFQARKIAHNLELSGIAYSNMVSFILKLYQAYETNDATLFEINPVVKTSDDLILAADAKVTLDDNALFRHPEFTELRDTNEEAPSETEAIEHNLNFIKLDGNVGCMVNGAGLAMATMDIIKFSGGEPANFLDVGGSANSQRVEAAFRIILKDPNVKAILINIFGGIVRCDRVAQGIVDAYKSIGDIHIPVIVRLQGTNATEAKELIDHSGLKVFSATTLLEAANKIKEVMQY
jgi:succinyl-CoA synthetase beta subunit